MLPPPPRPPPPPGEHTQRGAYFLSFAAFVRREIVGRHFYSLSLSWAIIWLQLFWFGDMDDGVPIQSQLKAQLTDGG